MGSIAASPYLLSSSSFNWVINKSPSLSPLSLQTQSHLSLTPSLKTTTTPHFLRFHRATRLRATLDGKDQTATTPLLVQDEEPNREVEESVKLLKNAAKTRRVAADEVLSALSVIEKVKIDPSGFFETLGGSESPGRTWMLVFTSKKQLKGGSYFPLTAVQRFDATAKRIENGVYLGPIGCLTFEGRLSWKKNILAFIFERIRIKVGYLKPLEISLGQKDGREPNTKDPFFIWFYVDEELAVARGRGGGTAFWCRCRRVARYDLL